MFKSPVAWTEKKTGTGLDWTDLDWTAGCSCIHFGMERPPVSEPVAIGFVKTGRQKGAPCKYLQNEQKNVENDQDLTELLNFY